VCAGAALRLIPTDLTTENRPPTLADTVAHPEFERAVRTGTLRTRLSATPSRPCEAKGHLQQTQKGLTISPIWRYCSAQKKGGLDFL
jgi:hypothetical protein